MKSRDQRREAMLAALVGQVLCIDYGWTGNSFREFYLILSYSAPFPVGGVSLRCLMSFSDNLRPQYVSINMQELRSLSLDGVCMQWPHDHGTKGMYYRIKVL